MQNRPLELVPTQPAPPAAPTRYFNRDLSWLEFNTRVLEEAASPETPLLERLKFLAIFTSNLDEFFMVRVAGVKKMVEEDLELSDSPDSMTGDEVLRSIRERVTALVQKKYRILHDEILPALREHGVELLQAKDLSDAQRQHLEEHFKANVMPVLTPLAVDAAHPFPFLTNLALYLVVRFRDHSGRDTHGEERPDVPQVGLVEVPSVLPRLIQVPTAPGVREGLKQYILLEDLVARHLGLLFHGFEIADVSQIRVTRNLDYNLLENEVVDLLKSVQREVTNREHQEAVRLDVTDGLPPKILAMLKRELRLTDQDIFVKPTPINPAGLMGLYGLPLANLKDPPFNPRLPSQMAGREDIFSLISEEDILLHHPFDTFYPTIEFLQLAAHDPNVLAIKQTLYRTSGDSPIIDALITAAENGKQVTAVVELKARFDEKNNISWARRLERAGVNVVFGFVGLKTHGKVILVVRREGNALVRYVNLATGNYNSNTAKLYTDLSFFTVDPDIGADVAAMFNLLTGFNILSGESRLRRKASAPQFKKIALGPLNLRSRIMELIQREITERKRGGKGVIIAKMNALVDKEVIDKLYEASQAGVEVKLIVRGICCLKPGVPGLSEHIQVISVVDRFLEHSRIYFFHAGGNREVYLSSADWMPRNLDRRIEVMFPITDTDLRDGVVNLILSTYLVDNVKARVLHPDGSYTKRSPQGGEPLVRSQTRLIEIARSRGVKSLPYDEAIRHDAVKERGQRPLARASRKKKSEPPPST